MLARYLPPNTDTPRESSISSEQDLDRLLAEAADLRTERGIPTLELIAPNGATLVIAQAGNGVVIMWIDALGESMHSVGSTDTQGTVVFDYYGSYTEVPAEFVVPPELGKAAALEVAAKGQPFVPGLTMAPD
ncbi:Imm1 family immunity protein [Jiangella alba]|nr:Imm1 family immunity protein [Jiangella alba]